MKQSLLTGLAALTSFLLANLLALPEPYWAVITVVMIFSDVTTHPFYKSLMRISGTFVGAIVGVLYIHFLANSEVLFFLGFLWLIFIFNYCAYHSRYSYAWLLGSITFFMIAATLCVKPEEATSFAYWRAIEISLGVVCAGFYMLFLPGHIERIEKKQPPAFGIKRSIKTSITSFLTLLLWLHTGWYDGIVGIITSQVIAFELHHQNANKKALERMLGCLLGAVIGFSYLDFASQDLLPTSLFILFTFTLLRYLQDMLANHRYIFIQAAIALALAIIAKDNQSTVTITPALQRLAGIALGISVTVVVNYCLWPEVHRLHEDKAASSALD